MKLKTLVAALGLAVVAHGAQAGLTVFTGLQGSGTTGAASAAFTSFSSGNVLEDGSLKQDDLESNFAPEAVPLPLRFGGAIPLATISDGGNKIVEVETSGRHSIGGGINYWDAGETFVISFTDPVTAFGFWITDLGDFGDPDDPDDDDEMGGVLTVTLMNGSVPVSTKTITGGANGNEIFWGAVLTGVDQITSVSFSRTNADSDGVGFDMFSIGEVNDRFDPPPNPTPEPGSLALMGLALAGLAGIRRRR